MTLGSGDPSMKAWWKDRASKCGQVLSPYECGYADKPAALCEPHEPHPHHPPEIPWWELPMCQEPIANGNNPLHLCALHLALYCESMRRMALEANRPTRYSTVIWDFRTDDHPSLYTDGDRAAFAKGRELGRIARESRETMAATHFEQLTREAKAASEAALEAKAKLEEAEAQRGPDRQDPKGAEENPQMNKREKKSATAPCRRCQERGEIVMPQGIGGGYDVISTEPCSDCDGTGRVAVVEVEEKSEKPKKSRKPRKPKEAAAASGSTKQANSKPAKPAKKPTGGGRSKALPGQRSMF